MRVRLFISLFFISVNSLAQIGPIKVTIIKRDSLLPYSSIKIFLFKTDTLVREASPDSVGNFILTDLSPRLYSLNVHATGYSKHVIDSFMVNEGESVQFYNITYPLPCYGKKYSVKCCAYNEDHTNRIVPIVYGIPSKRDKKRARKGLIFLGGDSDSDCEQKYYCQIHKRRM